MTRWRVSSPRPASGVAQSVWRRMCSSLPSVIVLLGVMIYPIAYGVYLSLFEYRMTQSLNWIFVGLGNYRRLFFQTPDFLNSIYVTAQFTLHDDHRGIRHRARPGAAAEPGLSGRARCSARWCCCR